jgi:hypothetical protein
VWAAILLFAILLPIVVLGTGTAFLWTAIAMLRRRSLDIHISFSSLVLAYFALMMLIGVFVTASGVGTIGKVALVELTSDNFGYNPTYQYQYGGFGNPNPPRPLTQSTTTDKKNTDVTLGAALVVVGLIMLAPHALGFTTLRRRGAHGADPVFRVYSLLALATATIGFLAAGGTTLGTTLRRVSNGGSWQGHAIAEPLAFAIVLLPLSMLFGYQLWTRVTADIATSEPPVAPASNDAR